MKGTPLHQQHLKLRAQMAPFAGVMMPMRYGPVKEEVEAVRQGAGVFDVSHMGEFLVEGADATPFVDYLLCNDFGSIPAGKALYSPMCREDGTVIDDLIAYKMADNRALLCVNAANIPKDWQWICSRRQQFSVGLSDISEETALLALQGPTAVQQSPLGGAELPYYGVAEREGVILARTGYTGEDGLEIFGDHRTIVDLWFTLLERQVRPCGLVARDVLRLEVAYPLYGHELHDRLTPLDAGLKWTVKLDGPDFIGKASLACHNPKYRLVKLVLSRGVPRRGHSILDSNLQAVGEVTSGTFSVTLGKGVALGLVERELFPADKQFLVGIRGVNRCADCVPGAFVKGSCKS